MSTVSSHVQHLAVLAELHDATDDLLSALSDHRWKDNQLFLIELLLHPDLIMKLCTSQDIFVRFSLQRLVSSMLCLRAPKTEQGHSLFTSQTALLDRIIATLISTNHGTDTVTTIETRQLLLEICHWVLKDARKQLEALQAFRDQFKESQSDLQQHVGLVLQERMLVTASINDTTVSPMSSIAPCAVYWLRCPALCYPTLVFLIDIEKNTRLFLSLFQPSGSIHHSCLTSQCVDQLLDFSTLEPTCLRKVLQLLYIHLRPPPPASVKEVIGFQQERSLNAQDSYRDNWVSPQEVVKIVQSLAPYATKLRQIMASPEYEPFLRQALSGIQTTTTHFVAMQSLSVSSQHRPHDPHCYFAQCALQDPETLRGFIRVFCQVALSGLQGLLLPALSNTVPATAEPCTQMMWIQVFDTWMEHITGFCCHRDWVAASQTLLGLHRFYGANSNIGKIFNTSDGNAPVDAGQLFWKAAFHLFGDDDADVTWLLHTTLDLTRKLESVVTQFRSSAALPQSLRVSGMTLYRLVELLIFVREGKPFSPTVENFLTTTTTTTAATVTAKHHIVFWGIQALDGYFFFLQTIGHDPQTVVDMLLSMDHQELGGFLAVTVSLIRYYLSSSSPSSSPEDLSNRERLLDRWNRMTVDAKLRLRGVHDEDAMAESEGADIEEEKDDEEDECDWTTTLARSHFCLHEVLTKLQALGRQGLLPFNPQVLICILDEFTDLIDKFLMPSAEQ